MKRGRDEGDVGVDDDGAQDLPHLPLDIVKYILRFCDAKSLCKMSETSHTMYKLACHNSLWKPLVESKAAPILISRFKVDESRGLGRYKDIYSQHAVVASFSQAVLFLEVGFSKAQGTIFCSPGMYQFSILDESPRVRPCNVDIRGIGKCTFIFVGHPMVCTTQVKFFNIFFASITPPAEDLDRYCVLARELYPGEDPETSTIVFDHCTFETNENVPHVVVEGSYQMETGASEYLYGKPLPTPWIIGPLVNYERAQFVDCTFLGGEYGVVITHQDNVLPFPNAPRGASWSALRCRFEKVKRGVFHYGDGMIELRECTFDGCLEPVTVTGASSLTIKDCTFSGAESSIMMTNIHTVLIDGAKIVGGMDGIGMGACNTVIRNSEISLCKNIGVIFGTDEQMKLDPEAEAEQEAEQDEQQVVVGNNFNFNNMMPQEEQEEQEEQGNVEQQQQGDEDQQEQGEDGREGGEEEEEEGDDEEPALDEFDNEELMEMFECAVLRTVDGEFVEPVLQKPLRPGDEGISVIRLTNAGPVNPFLMVRQADDVIRVYDLPRQRVVHESKPLFRSRNPVTESSLIFQNSAIRSAQVCGLLVHTGVTRCDKVSFASSTTGAEIHNDAKNPVRVVMIDCNFERHHNSIKAFGKCQLVVENCTLSSTIKMDSDSMLNFSSESKSSPASVTVVYNPSHLTEAQQKQKQLVQQGCNVILQEDVCTIKASDFESDADFAKAYLAEAKAKGVCTRAFTGLTFSVQPMFDCYSCGLVDHGGLCVVCAKEHQLSGHRVSAEPRAIVSSFCDCKVCN